MNHVTRNMQHVTQKGQAALIVVIFLLSISLAVVFGFSSLAVSVAKIARTNFDSKSSYFLAEAGQEDAVYRLRTARNISSQEIISLNGATVITDIVSVNQTLKEITSSSSYRNAVRNVISGVSLGDGVSFNYGVQVGYLGLEMKNKASIIGSIFSNGSVSGDSNASTTGDVWVAKGIGASADQQQLNQTLEFNIHDVDGRQDGAQSFASSVTAEPLKASFYVKKVGNPGDATIKIVPDNGGVPRHNQAVSSGKLKKENVTSSFGWVDMTFESTDAIISGAKYWLVIDTSSFNDSKYYVFGADDDGAMPNETFLYTDNWSSSSAVWNPPDNPPGPGDLAFKIFLGIEDTFIDEMEIGGEAHANTISDSEITGDAYYQNISNTTVGGVEFPGSPDPLPVNYPISDSQIASWKQGGDNGGTCTEPICDANGDYDLENQSVGSLGPIRIDGDLKIKNKSTLTVTGTIHVTGTADFEDQCIIKLDSSYGQNSGVIVVDKNVDVKNKCTFLGSGDPDSYLMIVTTDTTIDSPWALSIANSADGAIFYATGGTLRLHNKADVKYIFGHKVKIEDNSVVTYETGLADVNFTDGPAGGWEVVSWKEIE